MSRSFELLTALVIAAAPAATSAQGAASHATLGIYGGYVRSSLNGPDVPGPLHKNGFVGGVSLQWNVASRFAFQPEVQFIQKGNREVVQYSGGEYGMRIRLNYVEVPLLARVSGPLMGGKITPFLIGGPELAFRAGCGVTVYGLPGSYVCDDLPQAESVDYGLIGGGGLDVLLAGRHFAISARYDQGLKDVFKGNDPKNRALSIVLGVPLR